MFDYSVYASHVLACDKKDLNKGVYLCENCECEDCASKIQFLEKKVRIMKEQLAGKGQEIQFLNKLKEDLEKLNKLKFETLLQNLSHQSEEESKSNEKRSEKILSLSELQSMIFCPNGHPILKISKRPYTYDHEVLCDGGFCPGNHDIMLY